MIKPRKAPFPGLSFFGHIPVKRKKNDSRPISEAIRVYLFIAAHAGSRAKVELMEDLDTLIQLFLFRSLH